MASSVADVWLFREVLALLVRRDLTVKYQQSILGYFWTLLEPLAIAFTYWFVFAVLYNTSRLAVGRASSSWSRACSPGSGSTGYSARPP